MKNAHCGNYSETQQVIVEFLVPVPGFTLEECFAPGVLEMTFPAPDDAQEGWLRNIADGTYEAVAPSPSVTIIFSQNVRECLTLADQVKWDNDQTPQIVTVKTNFNSGLANPVATENMQFLYDTQSIGLASLDKFKATYPIG